MRRQRLLGAAIAIACAALTTGVSTAARAAPAAVPTIAFSIPSAVTLPIGGATRTIEARAQTADVEGPEAVFRLQDLAGVAELEFPDDCLTDGDRVTCPLPESGDNPFRFQVTPAATGTAGATGKLHITVQATDYGPFIIPDLTFTLSDGVDLAVAPFADGGTVEPEQALQVPAPVVSNLGNQAVAGIRLTFGFGDPTLVPTRYVDCTYTDTAATCDVIVDLPPEHEVTLSPFGFTTTADALGLKGVWVSVEALDAPAVAAAQAKVAARAGTGARWADGAAARAAQQVSAAAPPEINPADNGAEFIFKVANTYDIEALGATATGAVGDVVKVVIGARNNGPGTLDATRAQEFVWRFFFVVPPGTEVVGVPDRCAGKVVTGDSYEYVPGRAGVALYQCHHEAYRFPVNTSTTVEFSLKITQVTADAAGNVSWIDPDATAQPDPDANTTNDKASVVINPSAAGGGGGGGTNGGLPITGTNAVALASVGFGLVLAGGALYLVSRRRSPGSPSEAE